MRLAKSRAVIDRLSMICKALLSVKIKKPRLCQYDSRMRHINVDKSYWEKARRELYKNAMSYIEEIPEATSHKKAAVRSHL